MTVFLDQHVPTLLWISSKTKAFLVDLSYVVLRLNDQVFQLESRCEHYFVIQYFEEEVPFVFNSDE